MFAAGTQSVAPVIIALLAVCAGLVACVGLWAQREAARAFKTGWNAYRKLLRDEAIAAGLAEKRGSQYHWLSYHQERMEMVLQAEAPYETWKSHERRRED